MSKLTLPIAFVVVIVVSFVIKLNYKSTILKNSKTTTGKIIREFQGGKLPYCEFTYSVENISYNKKQEVPLYLKNKVLDSIYTVFYSENNPKKAMLKFD